jgi:2-polyprenyl-6-methoxyphenol hydroxylase-like FAD-dependent oxidoreductase
MRGLDRKDLIQALYDMIEDKSKIHTSAEVVKIEIMEAGVRVVTKDGSEFAGSIVAGGDGVHSLARQKMWRIADAELPGYISDQQHKSQ